MSASCPTDETERTARGGSWTVACALALRTAHPGTVPQHPGEAVATGGRVDAPGSWFPPHGCQWWREVAAVLPAGEHWSRAPWGQRAPQWSGVRTTRGAQPMSSRAYHTAPGPCWSVR